MRWQFTVQGVDRIEGRPCFRVEIRCQAPGASQPVTTLWADRQSLTPRQIEARWNIAGQPVALVESYSFPNGQAAPVQTPLTALPLDMPLLLGGEKGAMSYEYESSPGYAAAKAAGELGFALEIEQQVATRTAQQVKSPKPG